MFKRCCAVTIILMFCSAMLTGCWDSSEVDDNVYAIIMGLDKGNENKVIVTVQYPTYTPTRGGQSQTSGNTEEDSRVDSIESPAILESINLMNMAVSRRVSLLHTKMLVISEELAREGIGDFLSPLARFRGTRRTMFVVVTKGRAVDFINANKTGAGESVTKSLELMIAQSKNTGFFPYINFHEFYKQVISNYANPITIYAGVNDFSQIRLQDGSSKAPLVTQKDYKPGELPRMGLVSREFVGTALFNGDKMVGSLNPYETRCLLMIQNKFKKGIMTIEDRDSPGDGIIFSIRQGRKTYVKGRFEAGKPVIDLGLNIEADIGAIHSRINYERSNQISGLNKQLEGEIKREVERTIAKAKDRYKVDVFRFGKEFAGYFTTIQDWEKYDWLSHFPDAKVNVTVEVNIRRTGLMIESSPVTRGKH